LITFAHGDAKPNNFMFRNIEIDLEDLVMAQTKKKALLFPGIERSTGDFSPSKWLGCDWKSVAYFIKLSLHV
jgi:hypothetical protein